MPDKPIPVLISSLLAGVLFASIVSWGYAIWRWQKNEALAPIEPRRPTPWRFADVLLAFCLYFFVSAFATQAAVKWLDLDIGKAAGVEEAAKETTTDHPLALVLRNDPRPWSIFVCLLAAVVAAPIGEEFLFRLVLQGWLEAVERRLRRKTPQLRRLMAGVLSVGASSLLFAALHFRVPTPEPDVATILVLLQVRVVASLVVVAAIVCWLRLATGATLADFGIVPGRLWADAKLGLVSFAMAIVPIYGLMILVKTLMPEHIVVDPLPIFVLAAVLGGLVWRTHRIGPAIVLHMAFNAIGTLLAIGLSQ